MLEIENFTEEDDENNHDAIKKSPAEQIQGRTSTTNRQRLKYMAGLLQLGVSALAMTLFAMMYLLYYKRLGM